MRKLLWVFPLFLLMLVSGCAGGGRPSTVPDLGDASAAEEVYYVNAESVLGAVQKALPLYSFVAGTPEKINDKVWSLPISKGAGGYLGDDVTRIVIESVSERQTIVRLMMRKGFLGRKPAEPEWAKVFFTSIFESIP